MRVGAGLILLFLAGCADGKILATTDVPRPDAQLMQPCPALTKVPGPQQESDPRNRVEYYAKSRAQYGACADKAAGLQKYVTAITDKR
jgi:hypothetical protein